MTSVQCEESVCMLSIRVFTGLGLQRLISVIAIAKMNGDASASEVSLHPRAAVQVVSNHSRECNS